MSTTDTTTLLTTEQVAAMLHQTVGTIHKWNYRRIGPKFVRVGSRNLYRLEDVEAWLREREQ